MLEMLTLCYPGLQNYDSDEEGTRNSPVNKNASAPKLDDSSAFPEASWGSGSGSFNAPAGKSFAALASEHVPEQKCKTLDP